MNQDGVRDVTVIGVCDRHVLNYAIPFVFIRKNGNYVLDEELFNNLYGVIALTIDDIRKYIKNPNKYHEAFQKDGNQIKHFRM